jgi:hypothetical protein
MAETSDVGLLPRTYFKLPRVPFDFRAVALGILGYLTYYAGGLLLSRVVTGGKPNLGGAFLDWFTRQLNGLEPIDSLLRGFFERVYGFGEDPGSANSWEILAGGVWFVACWAFFGQAIRRIVALRIARDEGLGVREALGFALKNWTSVLMAPVIVGIAVGIFWGCNWLAGVAMSIPGLGMLLSVLLVPLAVLSTLLMLLIALGGVLGFPLVGAAAAWEKNGSLDAISRAFSYVYARPLQYFFNFFLILLFAGVILFGGSWFVSALTRSVEAGIWSDRLAITVDAPTNEEWQERSKAAQAGDEDDRKEFEALSKEAGEHRERTGYTGRAEPGMGGGVGSPAQPFVRDFQTVWHGPGLHKLTLFMFWLFVNLIWFGVFGYALFWYLGASCCLYADLRYDVDGTEEDEIHTDEDDQALETPIPGATPPSLPPAGTPLPPPPPPPGTPATPGDLPAP